MNTTLELPEDLMRALEDRAALEKRSLRELVHDLLTFGLSAFPNPPVQRDSRKKFGGLPVIDCGKPGDLQIDSAEVKRLLIEQELAWISASL